MWKKSILLVEDDEAVSELVKELIASNFLGIKVAVAADIVQAKKILENENPQLILLNTILNESNAGLNFLSELKTIDSKYKDTPVVMFSADNRITTKKECLITGASGFISKPFEIQELIETVKKYAE